jgi:hypothetical protein
MRITCYLDDRRAAERSDRRARATEAAALHGNNWAVLGGIDFCAFEWDGPCDARKIVADRNAPRVRSRARRCRYLNYSLETLCSNLASNFTVL